MAQNCNTKNTTRTTVPSHSRSISTIPNQQKSISFMPKFLLKTLHRRKPSHQRSISNSIPFNVSTSVKDHGAKSNEKMEKIRRIGKQFQSNNQLMQLMPDPKKVTSMMSVLFRNKNNNNDKNKRSDQEQCKDHKPRNLVKQVSKKKGSNDVLFTSKTCKFGVGDVADFTADGGRISRVNSVKNGDNLEEKRGVKIKRIIKLKSKEREKRFELCKKKILMGEKCRPLHGILRYDTNGVLVPEDFT